MNILNLRSFLEYHDRRWLDFSYVLLYRTLELLFVIATTATKMQRFVLEIRRTSSTSNNACRYNGITDNHMTLHRNVYVSL